MTRTDVIDNWSTSSQTTTFTYDNGETVDVTYSATRGVDTWLGQDQVAWMQADGSSVAFDQPVHNAEFVMSRWDVNEAVAFIVDGRFYNLKDGFDNGEITITSSGPEEGPEYLREDGRVGAHEFSGQTQPDLNELITVKFNIPIESVVFTGTSGQIGMDLFLDTAEPPSSYVAPCFTAGTLIDTDQGLVPVETLKTGDMIKTKDHGFQPVKWVGSSRVYASGFDVPLRIKAGTFGNTRDLIVSMRHKMLMNHTHLSLMFDVEEAFACAMHLRNDDTITREPEGWVTYYHVLLPQHEVIYAEGAATESFYPDEGTLETMAAKTRAELLETFDPETYGPPARLTFDPMRAMWIGRNLES